MKEYKLNQITTMQFIFLIHGTQLGVGMLQLPRILAEKAGTDGWICVLISWFFSTIIGLLVIQIMKKNPDKILPDLLKHYFGKWLGSILTIIFVVFFTCTAIEELLRAMLFVKAWLLPETPDYIIIASFAVPGYMITRGGIRILGRYTELVFYLTIWMPLFYLLPLKEGNWLNLLPFFKEGVGPILQGAVENAYSFFGSEIAFILYPMLQRKQYASIGMIVGNTLTMAAYLLAVVVCFVYFSPDEINRFNEPALSVLKTIEFRFINRLEILMFASYILVLFKTWMIFIWAATYSVSMLMGKPDHKLYLKFFLTGLLLYVVFFNHTFAQSDSLQEWIGNASLFISFAFPVFLYGYSLIYERFQRRNAR